MPQLKPLVCHAICLPCRDWRDKMPFQTMYLSRSLKRIQLHQIPCLRYMWQHSHGVVVTAGM